MNDATKTATAKHTHHHFGVGPSMMPQTLSLIHEKLRLFSTRTGRGSTAGRTSARMAGAAATAWSAPAINSVLLEQRSSATNHLGRPAAGASGAGPAAGFLRLYSRRLNGRSA